MAKKLYDEASVQAIANAIRAKNGEKATYKIGEMADAIKALSDKGVIVDDPAYFYAEVADTVTKLASLRKSGTLLIMFLTDSHLYTSSNNKQYFDAQMAAMKAVCAAIKPDLVVHGGDMTNGSESKAVTKAAADNVVRQMREVGGENTLILIGNHDGNYVSSSQSADQMITEAEMLQWYRSWDDGFTYPSGKLYGYRDYADLGIRVIRLHSYMGDGTLGGTGANWGYPADEVTWFTSTALDTNYDILLLSHQTLSPVLQGYAETQDIPHNGTALQAAIDSWQTSARHCIGVIHGHVHWDFVSKGHGTFVVIDHTTKAEVTRTGSRGNFWEYGQGLANYLTSAATANGVPVSSYRDVPKGAVTYGRTVGTETQGLWTAIVVDRANHHINFVRFGAGNDVSMDYLAEQTVPVTGIVLDASSGELTEGGSLTLTATVQPANATNQSVRWTSSAPGVATVSGGVVRAVAAGSCVITAETVDGGFKATYNLTVKEAIKLNMLTQAVGSDGQPYNSGTGYKSGFRLNSAGAENAYNGYCVTGFIPVTAGVKVTVKDIPLSYTENGQYYIGFYDASFKLISGCCRYAKAWVLQSSGNPLAPNTNDGSNILSFTLTGTSNFPVQTASYMRISSTSITAGSAVYLT